MMPSTLVKKDCQILSKSVQYLNFENETDMRDTESKSYEFITLVFITTFLGTAHKG